MISSHPLKVLKHAARHDYPNLVKEAVSYLVRLPTADVAEYLPTGYIIPWVSTNFSYNEIPADLAM